MDTLLIEGGQRLEGELRVQGSKNAVLPILAGSILCTDSCALLSCPDLSDVKSTMRILSHLGCGAQLKDGVLRVDSSNISANDIPDPLMRTLRSSIIFLGALAVIMGSARLSFPGGCSLGARPIDLHLKALRALGMEITEEDGCIEARVGHLKSAHIDLAFPSVGATENALLAAVKIKGESVITNAAREPEIVDLANFLNAMGAKIRGAGTGTIRIEGVASLRGTQYTVMPDRIAASTYLCAAAACGGEVELHNVRREHLTAILSLLDECGAHSEHFLDNLYLRAPERLRAASIVRTQPYPGFPTDAQSLVMAALVKAQGTSVIVENIFENRYKIIPELCRMGASVVSEGRVAIIRGVEKLCGASLVAPDLRGGAALAVAAMSAEGESVISGIEHIERGYENFEGALSALGAKIKRTEADSLGGGTKEKETQKTEE